MKYPRIKPILDRRRVFTPTQEKEIIKRFKGGQNISMLRVAYGVAYSTIKYIVDPEYKEKRKKMARDANKLKRLDPVYRKKHRMLTTESHRYKRRVMKTEETAYDKNQLKEWKRKRMKVIKNT